MSRNHPAALLLVAAATVLADFGVAQIDVINHRQWAWLMQRRRQLLAAVAPLPPRRQAAVAAVLGKCREAVPQLTLARAMALARGVEADAQYRFRAGLQVLAMPEVVSKESFKHLAVTIYAPHVGLTGELPMPRRIAFALRVTDQAGEEVWRGRIDKVDDIRALREFRVSCEVPTEKLADGAYHVHVDTILDGVASRPHDLPLGVSFAVFDGFKKRGGYFRLGVESSAVFADLQKLAPIPQAILHGAAESASRAWFGIPGVSSAQSVPALLRAEAILKNLNDGKSALLGLRDYVDIALPGAGKNLVFVAPRLPAGGLPVPDSEAWRELARRPLLLVIGRRPSWDIEGRRPSHPPSALPGYLAAALQAVGFDAARRFQVLLVESPGRMPPDSLQQMLGSVAAVLPCDPQRLILVGEGHGAVVAAGLALSQPQRVRGLVLLGNGGGLATPQLRRLQAVPILALGCRGQLDGELSLDRLQTYAKIAGRVDGLEIEASLDLPWSIALPLLAPRIEAFARRVSR